MKRPWRRVIVPSGGEGRYNIECVESLEAQTRSLTTVCCWCNVHNSLKQYSTCWLHIFILVTLLIISIKNRRNTQHHSLGAMKDWTESDHAEPSSIVQKKEGERQRGAFVLVQETPFFQLKQHSGDYRQEKLCSCIASNGKRSQLRLKSGLPAGPQLRSKLDSGAGTISI